MTDSTSETVTIAAEENGGRLDRVLAARIPALSRSRLKALILDGQVSIEARTILDPSSPVKSGDVISVNLPPPDEAEPRGEDIPLTIVFEDDALIVIDKPKGLVVHPSAGHATGTLVNALIAHCGESLSGIGGVKRPGIVHRLDKGTINAPLDRHPHSREKRTVREGGREAITHWQLLETFKGQDSREHSGKPVASLVTCRLETGRTHQIRVHLAHISHPILGDETYGTGFKTKSTLLPEPARDALAGLGRQALHAYLLGFEHPESGEFVEFKSALPADLAKLHAALRG
jgi:23S rRNA pseudouridine1911/1915/1917 synthase